MSEVVFYRCEKCGNMVALMKNGGGTLTCCGQPMTKLVANTTDAAKEKHVPAIAKQDGKIKVAVGSTLHPMLPEHYIEWIHLQTEQGAQIKHLKPGDTPEAVFKVAGDDKPVAAFAYCNLHGLWKADF